MFASLEEELAAIRTKRFHVVDGPASDDLRRAVVDSPIPAPPSYVAFVLRFGNAKLYRMTGLSTYRMRVFASPQAVESRTGEPLLYVGGYGETCAYFRPQTLMHGAEAPVFESAGKGIRQAADSFDAWLAARAARARRHYGRREWAEVLRGPPPFTLDELAIVQARRLFIRQVAGVAADGAVMFEVTNGSSRRLPFLTVGIRSTDGKLQGAVWLPVDHIGPGESAVIAKDTYRHLVVPGRIEAFSLPDPEPEERARYWEFGHDSPTGTTGAGS